jgi:hypothetical protein
LVPEDCLTCDSINFHNTYKLDPVPIAEFVNHISRHIYNRYTIKSITKSKKIELHKVFFCAETIRDIYAGRINFLLNDSCHWQSNKIGGFGFLAKPNSKKQREAYNDMTKHMEHLEYFETAKFNRLEKNKGTFLSMEELKSKYKYLIDLKGHTYSTKSYLFLASKRVYFSSAHPETLNWEKEFLLPWKHYIPVKEDLSDLNENYNKIENNPNLYNSIIDNNIRLLRESLSTSSMMEKLAESILDCCIYSRKA